MSDLAPTMDSRALGLRERKKAKTRKLISDIATRLFIERGFHSVTTSEIAQLAEVSVTTLFKYFPTKEALVFDEDKTMEAALVGAVVSRHAETSIVEAVRRFFVEGPYFRSSHDKAHAAFSALIRSTPELAAYVRQMSLRYEKALARAIERSAGSRVNKIQAAAIARYALDAVTMAQRFPKQAEAFNTLINLLRDGTDI